MNLLNIYEAALENAKSNDIEFDVKYIIDFVDGALNESISKDFAQKIINAHKEWIGSDRGSHNYYVLVQSNLEEIEI